ncbi:hypothetical protein [Flagellimonas sediminis]|uniref:Transmembrane protein n=1 Tax=Flagellimonas sediminis TaxID=2696468 RepID=A0A6I5KTM6_9FLAO|nr:hypothetical protein [Allomuricauda sediminis]NDV41862.1 hypothetical protein [Allomuricauda sediminis]
MKNMVYIILGIIYTIQITAQNFSAKQQQRLNGWELDYEYLIKQSEANGQKLLEILDMDRKRKNNLIMGSSFAGLGLLFLTTGSLILGQDADCNDTRICENTGQFIVGGGLMVIGTFEVGVSLPLFFSAVKRKNKRNRIIKELQLQYPIMSQQ